jgi:hypothetical protein
VALAACYVTPPGLTPDELSRLEKAETGGVRLHWRADELTREQALQLLSQLSSIAQSVSAQLGCAAPPAAVALWVPGGVSGSGRDPIHTTHGVLSEGRVTFRYPWDPDDPGALDGLLATAAHELSEAAILGRVTAIDPYLRWLHDGLAELCEHQVLLARSPEQVRQLLGRNLELLAGQRARGLVRIDLERWRQLAPWVIRSQRFLDEGGNLSLEDFSGSRRRVNQALLRAGTAELRRKGLEELLQVLNRAEELSTRPWSADEARPDDPALRDFLFYVSSLAVWLDLERRAPGAARRAVAELGRRRAQDDHVLQAGEGREALLAAAAGVTPLPLGGLPLLSVEAVLRAELERLGPAPVGPE